jgi:large conductance mechanosensitive channel
MASIREDFVKFINRGNLIQLAIAFVMGAAFAALVTALVADFITPAIGALINVDLASYKYEIHGSYFYPGSFVSSVISFVFIALVVFFLIALPYQRYLDRQAAKVVATTHPCPECLTEIPLAAKRCASCGQPVTPATAPP